MKRQTLLSPYTLGDLKLKNKIIMAPMTRSRASADGTPTTMMEEYYKQRSEAGLIISEATNISPQAIGSPLTPGIYTDQQIKAWSKITDAVHNSGGLIFCQLWHTGRVAHSIVRGGILPVAPSAIAISGQKHFTGSGMLDYEVPKALSQDEIKTTIKDFGIAAQNAKTAGFDGVELHAAFGYLPNQFLVESANQRTDLYGGSISNRCRFILEVMGSLIDILGSDRVGIKLSPVIPFNNMVTKDPIALYTHLIKELNNLNLSYIHLMNAMFPLDNYPTWPKDVLATFGKLCKSPVITNGGYNPESAEQILDNNLADLVSFATLFIANPDLPSRIEYNQPLADGDRATFYGGSEHGYIDYPRSAKTAS